MRYFSNFQYPLRSEPMRSIKPFSLSIFNLSDTVFRLRDRFSARKVVVYAGSMARRFRIFSDVSSSISVTLSVTFSVTLPVTERMTRSSGAVNFIIDNGDLSFRGQDSQPWSGRSAVAAAAYLSCSRMLNEYDGVQHDYTCKQGLGWRQVFLPATAPAEWQDRETLWNAVEETETAKDSRLAREFVAALPIELSREDQIRLLQDFIKEQFVADGMCADAAIHDPYPPGHNPHAHILLTVRPLDEKGKWQYKTEKEYLCVKDGEERGQVKKLAQAVKNTIPALADAMENLRKNLLLFCYQLGYLRKGKKCLNTSLNTLRPALAQYNQLAKDIRDKTKERRSLLTEKKALSAVHVFRHRELAAKIATLTEDLEETLDRVFCFWRRWHIPRKMLPINFPKTLPPWSRA